MYLQNSYRVTDLENKLKVAGGRMREGTIREFGMGMYTQLYLKWKAARTYCIACGTLLSVMWEAGWERSLGGMGMTESLPCPPETVTTLLINSILKIKHSSHRSSLRNR